MGGGKDWTVSAVEKDLNLASDTAQGLPFRPRKKTYGRKKHAIDKESKKKENVRAHQQPKPPRRVEAQRGERNPSGNRRKPTASARETGEFQRKKRNEKTVVVKPELRQPTQ